MLKEGQTIQDRYKLLSRLGEGGFGSVFLAFDNELKREVALKALKSVDLNAAEDIERFRREAKLLARLSHENIVTIYAIELSPAGEPFLIVEYLKGRTLLSFLSKRSAGLKYEECKIIFGQVLNGLSYAHSQGILHRDLNPSNVFILDGAEHTTKIIDFGLARLYEADTQAQSDGSSTLTRGLIGNPAYMSPEQCRSEKLDQRSDIYSIGCVLYQALCGKAPFEADNSIALLYMHQKELPLAPEFSWTNAQAAARYKKAVLKCMQKEKENRFQSVEELIATLSETSMMGETGSFSALQFWKKEEQGKGNHQQQRVLLLSAFFVIVLAGLAFFAYRVYSSKTKDESLAKKESEYISKSQSSKKGEKSKSHIRRLGISPNSYELPYMQGREFLHRKQYREAISYFSKAIELNPSAVSAYTGRATAYQELGDLSNAISDYSSLIKLCPENANFYLQRAWGYEKSKTNTDKAIADCTKALELAPGYNLALLCRARIYRACGQTDKVIQDLTKSIELDSLYFQKASERKLAESKRLKKDGQSLVSERPLKQFSRYGSFLVAGNTSELDENSDDKSIQLRYVEALIARAACYREQKESEKELADLNKAIEIDPRDPRGYLARASFYQLNKQGRKALADCNKLIELRPEESIPYLARASYYRTSKEFEKALADCKKAENIAVDKLDCFLQRGACHFDMKEYELAAKDHSQAIELSPSRAPFYLARADCFVHMNEFKKAKADIEKALTLEAAPEQRAKAYASLAAVYGALLQSAESIEASSKAIEIDGSNPDLYKMRGLEYEKRGQIAQAIEDLSSAIKLDPANSELYTFRAAIYRGAGQHDKAIADSKKALALNKNNAMAYLKLADNYGDLGEFASAIAECNKAAKVNPAEPWVYIVRGRNYLNLGQHEKAVADYTRAIELAPGISRFVSERAWCYLALKKREKALNDFNSAIKLDPLNPYTYLDRLRFYTEAALGYDKALADCNKAIELNPLCEDAYLQRAWIFAKQKEPEKALKDFDKTIELAPFRSELYRERASFYIESGQMEKALADCNKAVELCPSKASAFRVRAACYEKMGELKKAIADFDRAIKLNPINKDYYKGRARCFKMIGQDDKARDDEKKANELALVLKSKP